MTTNWYIGFDNQVVGPVDLQQLLDFLRSSEQWRQILIWHEGFDEWKLAKDVPDVASQVSKGPPPLPAPPKPETPKLEAPSLAPDAVPAGEAVAPETAAPSVVPSADAAAPALAAAMAAETARHETPAKPKRRFGVALILLIALGGAGAYIYQMGRKDFPANAKGMAVATAKAPANDVIVENGFADIVKSTAPNLPKKLNDYVTIFDVTPAGKRLVYHHMLDTTKFLVLPNFSESMKQKTLVDACTTAARELIKAGGTFEYRFHTPSSFFIGSFEVGGNDCDEKSAG